MIITNKNEEFERNYAIYDDLTGDRKRSHWKTVCSQLDLHKEVNTLKLLLHGNAEKTPNFHILNSYLKGNNMLKMQRLSKDLKVINYSFIVEMKGL